MICISLSAINYLIHMYEDSPLRHHIVLSQADSWMTLALYIALVIGLDQPQISTASPEGECTAHDDIPAIEGLLD